MSRDAGASPAGPPTPPLSLETLEERRKEVEAEFTAFYHDQNVDWQIGDWYLALHDAFIALAQKAEAVLPRFEWHETGSDCTFNDCDICALRDALPKGEK